MKKTLSILLALVMLASVCAFAAEEEAAPSISVTVGSVSGEAGEMVVVPVNVDSELPLISLTVRVTYDLDKLEYIEYADIADRGEIQFSAMNGGANPEKLLAGVAAATTSNIEAKGLFCNFRFNIKKDTAPGSYPVKVIFVEAKSEAEGGNIILEAKNTDGEVTVKKASGSSGGSHGGSVVRVTSADSDAQSGSEKSDNAADKESIILTIDNVLATVFGEEIENDVAPKIVNDRTMLPIRFIAEALGATVSWDEALKLVKIEKEGLVIELTVDEVTAYINGEETELDSPAFIENSRTYCPVRFVSEALNAKVDWNEETKQVIITKK